jgi:uncharacterized delta-60 repeat protein
MKNVYILLLILFSFPSYSQPGNLDLLFGNYGMALGPFTTDVNHGNAIVQHPDGRLIVAGHLSSNGSYSMFVVRYTHQGNIDLTFGDMGVVYDSVGSSINYARAIAVQSDSNIVVAGDYDNITSSDFFVKRYLLNGDHDSTFGTNGTVTADFSLQSGDQVSDMVIQQDGKIIITGWTYDGNDKDIVLLRYNPNGTSDSTFGINGSIATDIAGNDEEANAITLQPDGKILITGFTFQSGMANELIILRFNSDGSIDSTFNNDGIYNAAFNSEDDEGNSIAVQQDGKIIVAGTTYNTGSYFNSLLIRLDSMGYADTTFNSTGFVETDIQGFDNTAEKLLLQGDGKIITCGGSFSTSYDLSLSRFNVNGSIDSTFGNYGHVSTPVGIEDEYFHDAILQSDNKIAATGFYTDSGLENIFTARYLNDSLSTFIKNISDSHFDIYPVPFNNAISIKGINRINEIEVIDLSGKIIFKTYPDNNFTSMNLNTLTEGIYLLKLLSDGEVITRLIVKSIN